MRSVSMTWLLLLLICGVLVCLAKLIPLDIYVNKSVTLFNNRTFPIDVPVFDFHCIEANVLKNKMPVSD